MIWLLGGLFTAATLAFILLCFGLLCLYDWLAGRYQARRKHVLHTTAADERVIAAERESMGRLRALPEPGKTYITDRNVWLPRTLPAAEPGPPVVADITDADRPARVPPACSICDSYGHWTQHHDAAKAQVVAFRPEPETTLDTADSTFVRALLALPLNRVHEAFTGARS